MFGASSRTLMLLSVVVAAYIVLGAVSSYGEAAPVPNNLQRGNGGSKMASMTPVPMIHIPLKLSIVLTSAENEINNVK